MSDIVKRIREVFDDTPEIVDMCDESYEGQEIASHLQGLYDAALEAADEIERLENQLSHIIEYNNPQIEQANSYFKSLEEELDRCNKIIDEYEEEDNKLRKALRRILQKCPYERKEKWCACIDCNCIIARVALGEEKTDD
jgi:DNA repair exonuclease SbcCD ATPase subunit